MLRNIFGLHSESDSSDDDNMDSRGLETDLMAGHSNQLEVSYKPQDESLPVIRLQQQPQKGIAHQLWPAAAFLCDFLETHKADYLGRTTSASSSPELSTLSDVLELGAGVGLCGIFCAKLGCPRVVITDLAEALDTITANISLNASTTNAEAAELRWGEALQTEQIIATFDAAHPPLVIAADCVYWECLYMPLLQTLRQLVDFGCVVVMAHVRRWKKDGKFFQMCKKYMCVEVLLEVVDTERDDSCDRTLRRIRRIYKMMKRSS